MYPNLYFFVKEVFGADLQGFKLVNSFGLLVALSFLAAAWALSSELKRRERNGWLHATESEIWIGKGADFGEIIWNAFFGFIAGWKFVGFFTEKEIAFQDPQAFLLSGMGNVPAGILLGLFFAGLKWYTGNKTKTAKPEKRSIRIWPHDRVGDMTIMAAVFGFGGAKIFHNLENWDELVRDPVGSLLSFSGLTFYGGLICAGAAILIYAKKHKIDRWHLVDSFGPALMLAYALGRLGCQVSGDGDWGILNSAYVSSPEGKSILAGPTDFQDTVTHYFSYYQNSLEGVKEIKTYADVMHTPVIAPSWLPTWMVAYSYPHNVLSEGIPNANCEGQWCNHLPVPVFPTPFYETIMGLILFAFLWGIRKKLKVPGMLFGVYLVVNGLERFLIEKIRVNTTYNLGGFHPSQAQLISFVLILAGIAIIIIRRRQGVSRQIQNV
ncbi:MAG: prolipoprotein diacylglyceryl transferase family protein [Bacteroidota bacterium]